MATVDGYTKAHMDSLVAANIVGGTVDVNKHLQLTRHDGTTVDAGLLPAGPTGPAGSVNTVNGHGGTDPVLTATDVGAATPAQLAALVPAGSIILTAASAVPTGYAMCDGSTFSRTGNPNLFAAIGTTYGIGDGSTTANLPNLKGRVAVGQDATQTEFAARGNIGGEKTHLLVVAEMPSHTHLMTQYAQGASTSFGRISASTTGGAGVLSQTGAGGLNSAGGDTPHNNLQPYITLNYIIKTS